MQHKPGIRQRHLRTLAQRREGHRQVPHIVKHANEAVDKVRKQEARGNALLKRTKYLWLRNESNLTGLQLETKRSLQRRRLKTGRACQMRETLQDIYDTSADRAEAETALKLCLFNRKWAV